MERNNFYVYAWLDPRKPGKYVYDNYSFNYEPYYIGKGKKYRKGALTNRNKFTINKLNKIQRKGFENRIYMIKDNLTEENAFKLECEVISFIGRIDLGKGTLTNMSDGGEGNSGHIFTEESLNKMRGHNSWKGRRHTVKTKRKLSEINTGKIHSEETKKKIQKSMKGRIVSEETREKLREASTGKKHSDETKKMFSKVRKGRPNGRLGCKHTEEVRKKMSVSAKKREKRTHSEETKKKISLSKIGEKNPMYGKQVSEETKRKISEGGRGKKRSLETRRRLSESKIGDKNPMWKGGTV